MKNKIFGPHHSFLILNYKVYFLVSNNYLLIFKAITIKHKPVISIFLSHDCQ